MRLAPLPSFYGVGLSYPMRVDGTKSRPVVSRDEQLVLESMDQIINTGVDERPLLVRNGVPFGTRCGSLVFESIDAAIDTIRYELKRALDIWEPRIAVDSVSATEYVENGQESGIISVVHFRFRASNRPDNFVTPFKVRL